MGPVLLAVLAAGLILAVLQHDTGPWVVALGGALATFMTVVGIGSKGADATDDVVAQRVHTGWAAVRTELARSRRHNLRFAIAGIPEAVWSRPGATSAERPKLGLEVAEAVRSIVRRPDHAWTDPSMVHVLLTDCDRGQGLAFLQRARAALPQLFADDRVRLVVFPDDGITVGALVAALREEPLEESEIDEAIAR